MRDDIISIALIDPPRNPSRLAFDRAEMDELEQSIKSNGLINPILVKAVGNRYEVIAGHRRLTAHQQLQLGSIRCTVTDDAEQARADLQQMAENFDRANLTPMEEAIAVTKMIETFDGDISRVMSAIHRGRGFIDARTSLMEMPAELKELVHERKVSIGSALTLARIIDNDARAYHIAHTINGGASEPVVRSWVELYLSNLQHHPDAPPTLPPTITPGETVTIFMPCYFCSTPKPYLHMRMQRICESCTQEYEKEARPNTSPTVLIA